VASKTSLKVSVTALADFSCRTGNLELSATVGPSAKEGMKAHQRIQAIRASQSEVKLEIACSVDSVKVTLSGRVDLIDSTEHRLSEIKSTYVPADKLSESKLALQWAQLKLYGYCYLQQLRDNGELIDSQSVQLELIHANLRTLSETSDQVSFSFDELEVFAIDAITRYVEWHQLVWRLQEDMKKTAADLSFPFPQYRKGQRDMAAAIFRAARDGETLLCEAPTGTGKTLSSLFPAVKAIGEGQVKHAVYLTAKTAGREAAMQAIRKLEAAGLHTTSVQIRSKAPTCFCSNGRCERDDNNTCPMTIGFFDRLPAAREEAINAGVLDGKALDNIAWEHQLCPFELALQLLPWVSLVVADFNYVFDPLVRIGRFSESRRDTLLLVDEAHNLLDRSRGMHSGALLRDELLAASKLLSATHAPLAREINSLCSALLSHAKSHDGSEHIDDEVPLKLVKKAGEVIQAYSNALDSGEQVPEPLFDVFKMACRFAVISDLYGAQHKTVSTSQKRKRVMDVSVNLKCLDAAEFLRPQYKLFRSSIVFSATLRPAPFYRDALGLPEDAQQLVLGSPFSPDQVKHLVATQVNTRYQHRQSSTNELVRLLETMISSKQGNYMVFFPSYAYLEQVQSAFSALYPAIDTWTQPRNSTEDERASLLGALENADRTRLGFAILGGVFGESIDYVGDLLIGVALVGVGLPGIGAEQDLIANCYREQGLDGFDYAYRYPGFTKVLQTAGRVIRTETDRGVVLLIDDRFDQAFYRALYPQHWEVEKIESQSELESSLRLFWEREDTLATT